MVATVTRDEQFVIAFLLLGSMWLIASMFRDDWRSAVMALIGGYWIGVAIVGWWE